MQESHGPQSLIHRDAPGILLALSLAAISLIGPLSVHLFLPAIPAVKVGLGLSNATAQLTFSIAVFSMAVATLFYGSLSDRYGRRPVLLSGLALFLIGSAVSAFAHSVLLLIVGRLIQAIGAGCGVTLVRAIAQDLYGPSRLIKAIAYLTMAYTIGPMISPIVGGVLIDAFGWRSVFAFALALGIGIAILAYLVVFESHPPNNESRHSGEIIRSYVTLFRDIRFSAFVFQTGFSTSSFMVAATAASTLMNEVLHRSSTEFGIYFVLFPFGLLCGNFLTTRIGNRIANETMVFIGSLLSVGAVGTQTALILGGDISPLTLFAPGFLITFAQGLALSYAQAGAMATNLKLAGTAAGIGVFVQNFCGALFAQIYGIVADGTAIPLTEITGVSAALCLVAGAIPFVIALRRRRLAAFRT